MSKTHLTVTYITGSFFELDFDLNKVHKWYIEWDELFVVHNKGENACKYIPNISYDEDYEFIKFPNEVHIKLVV